MDRFRFGPPSIGSTGCLFDSNFLADSPVGVHGDAVAAEQGAIQVAVVPPAVALVHRQQDQTALVRLDVFGGRVAHLVAARQRWGER